MFVEKCGWLFGVCGCEMQVKLMRRIIFFFLFEILSNDATAKLFSDTTLFAQKGNFYLLWGYNRDAYTKSTIHFKNDGNPLEMNEYGVYDFTIYDAVAHDRPNFDKIHDVINFTIPQYNYRMGYYFNNHKDWGIEINFDHAKYVVVDWQTVHIKGTILGQAVDKDTLLNPAYFHFEHTDGANFLMVNGLKRWKFVTSKNSKHNLGAILKAGAGIVIPRTDVTIFGDRLNNNWHIAGVIVGVETGLRAELWKHWVMEFTGKLAYADYMNCLVHIKGNGSAQQMFGTVECVFTMGYQFGNLGIPHHFHDEMVEPPQEK
jgi:hypothetical protein